MSSPVPAAPEPSPGAAAESSAAVAAGKSLSGAAPLSAAPIITCSNCGAPLRGEYCSDCGQRHHEHAVHHFRHFIGEALEDLTHADSRLWRTLTALLFQGPWLTLGKLTVLGVAYVFLGAVMLVATFGYSFLML